VERASSATVADGTTRAGRGPRGAAALLRRLSSDGHVRDIVRGASVTLLMRVAGGGLEFLLNLVIARAFGAEGAGVFYIALTTTTIGSTFARLGLDNSMLRLSAAHAATGEWPLVSSAATRGLLATTVVSVVLSALIFVAAGFLTDVRPDLGAAATAIRIMSLAIAPVSLSYLYGELFKSLRMIFVSQLVAAVAVPGIAVAFVAAVGHLYGVEGLSWGYVTGAAVAASLGYLCWRRAMAGRSSQIEVMPWQRLFDGTWSLLWIKSMRLATGWLATAALTVWSTTSEVGIFNVANRISVVLGLLLISVNSVVAPRFSAQIHLGDWVQLDRTARKATLLVTIFGGPPVALFLLAPGWVMSWFGNAFSAKGASVMFVLALGQAVNLLTGPVNYLLMMGGQEQALSRQTTLSVVIGAATLALLAPAYGALGAAIATSLAMILQKLGSAHHVWKIYGIATLPFLPRRAGSKSA
jgi:O-antigen/teichoic acid export membrane protein